MKTTDKQVLLINEQIDDKHMSIHNDKLTIQPSLDLQCDQFITNDDTHLLHTHVKLVMTM